MEGSYTKVWRARERVPRAEYGVLLDSLVGTIRCVGFSACKVRR